MHALHTDLLEKSFLVQLDKSRNNQLWEADTTLLYILLKLPFFNVTDCKQLESDILRLL